MHLRLIAPNYTYDLLNLTKSNLPLSLFDLKFNIMTSKHNLIPQDFCECGQITLLLIRLYEWTRKTISVRLLYFNSESYVYIVFSSVN